MGDVSTYTDAEQTYGHPLQYAMCRDEYVGNTEDLSDDEVRVVIAKRHGWSTYQQYNLRVDRYNRCPTCEQWSPCDKREEPAHPEG